MLKEITKDEIEILKTVLNKLVAYTPRSRRKHKSWIALKAFMQSTGNYKDDARHKPPKGIRPPGPNGGNITDSYGPGPHLIANKKI